MTSASVKRWHCSISLFSKMGDKGEGWVKNLFKWVTSFIDGCIPRLFLSRDSEFKNKHLLFSGCPWNPYQVWYPFAKQTLHLRKKIITMIMIRIINYLLLTYLIIIPIMKKVIVDHGHNQCNCTYKLSSYDFCSLLDEIYIIFFKANNLK